MQTTSGFPSLQRPEHVFEPTLQQAIGLVLSFKREGGISDLALQRVFGINHRTVRSIERGKTTPSRSDSIGLWRDAAYRLATDREGVESELGLRTRAQADPTALMDAAGQVSRSVAPSQSFAIAAESLLCALTQPQGLSLGIRLLHRAFYFGTRFADPCHFTAMLEGLVLRHLPEVIDARTKAKERVFCDAAIAQLACFLTEGGQLAPASQAFVLSAEHDSPSNTDWPAHLPPMLDRAKAHLHAWKTEANLATQWLDSAIARNPHSAGNAHSVMTTRCELGLSRENMKVAFEAIRDAYHDARVVLKGMLDPKTRYGTVTTVTVHHRYASLYYGIVTRSALDADGYTQEEREIDLALVNACERLCGGLIRIGSRSRLPVDRPVSLTVHQLIEATCKLPLSASQLDTVNRVINRLT